MTSLEWLDQISQTLSEPNIVQNDASPSSPTSQAKEITALKRVVDELKAENKAAVERARHRYADMIWANRRAERAEYALKKECAEKEGVKTRAFAVTYDYELKIQKLEHALAQEDQSRSSEGVMQALQAKNVELEAALEEEKAAKIQTQLDARKKFDEFEKSIRAQKTQVEKDAKQLYERRLTGEEKRLSKHYLHKFEASESRSNSKVESLKKEHERIKRQLQQAQQSVEWYKAQAQQSTVQRGAQQRPQTAVNINTVYPLQDSGSSAQENEPRGKRKRHEATGRVSSTGDTKAYSNKYRRNKALTSEEPQGRSNPRSHGRASVPVQRTPCLQGQHQSPQRSTTQTRQCQSGDQHQHLNKFASPIRPVHQTQSQALLYMNPHRVEHRTSFPHFAQQVNVDRLNKGLPQASQHEDSLQFNASMARMNDQPVSTQMSSLEGPKPILQQYTAELPTFDKRGVGRCPSPSASTPIEQRELRGQQQQQDSHGKLQSVPNRSEHDLMPLLTTSHHADMTGKLSINLPQAQAMPSLMNEAFKESVPAFQISSQLGDDSSQLFPENLQVSLYGKLPSANVDANGWNPLMHNLEGPYSRTISGTSLLHDFDFSDLMGDPDLDAYSGLGDINWGLSSPALATEETLNEVALQHTEAIVQAFDNEPQLPLLTMNIDQAPATGAAAPVPGRAITCSSPSIVLHPTAGRKAPVKAQPARAASVASGCSTPAQGGPPLPVCLHCHENWWNATCDLSEPCQNCLGSNTRCERPKCVDFAKETCSKPQCARVHEGDVRFAAIVDKPKTLKRIGKRDQRKLSPVELSVELAQPDELKI